jgi:hypothetical protein
MTENEWRNCTDPEKMLELLRDSGKANERRCRLVACASVRRVWHLLTDGRSRRAVEMAEAFIEGSVKAEDLATALAAAARATLPIDLGWRSTQEKAAAAANVPRYVQLISARFTQEQVAWVAAAAATGADPLRAATVGCNWSRTICHAALLIEPAQVDRQLSTARGAALIRDIFGNPFHPATLDPPWLSWHDGLLVSMAQKMYDRRDSSDMPILADALEEAGCDNAEILNHCRQPGPHVRGCWVVDLLLGKA